jgi:UDP-galactopyranose mutase
MVVNYPSPDVPFTRIVEYKHVPNQPTAVKQGKVRPRSTMSTVSTPQYSEYREYPRGTVSTPQYFECPAVL